MAECRAMVGLGLDQRSIDTLERIKNKHAWGSALTTVLSAGVFSSIFTKSPAAQAAFNITQTDWDLYARAMGSVPVITKAAIQKEVQFMILDYQIENNPQLLQFWQGIYDGCQ